MIRECAWCRRQIGQIAPLDDESVTHGLCKECHVRLVESSLNGPMRPAKADLSASALLSVKASE